MRKLYNSADPIKTLYKKFDDGYMFVIVARLSYTLQQIVNIMEVAIIVT